ncbi:MAG TPA: GGDEF domain-containing protein [Anaerolineales bacterium]|nr:GGDEF domain-containing protein [Anaerolineales bacterium]
MSSVEQWVAAARKTLKTLPARTFNWYRENKQATHDLVGLFLFSVFTYFIIRETGLARTFLEFTRQQERQIEELVFTLGVVSLLSVSIFALRRWAEAAKRLEQANTDSLTRLFNRRKGWEVMEHEIARSNRYGWPLSIIMFDIDHFKTINDTHGHRTGDRVLIAVATVARESIRSIDELIRWGGEEFIVLLPETDLEAALPVAERLREAIAGIRVKIPNDELSITASIGVTRKDEHSPDLETLLARADQALYIAKFLGRNRVARSK